MSPLARNGVGALDNSAIDDKRAAGAGAEDDAKHDPRTRRSPVGRFRDGQAIRVVGEPDRTAKCTLEVPGPDLYAEDWEADLYAAIDLSIKKVEQQIRKRQSKYKARKHKQASRAKRSRQEQNL